MGDLIRTPYSEITATIETLDRWGVGPEHLAKFRAAPSYIQWMIAQAIILCREDFFAGQSRILLIDRSQPFHPAGFIGKDWSVWRVSAESDGLEGEEEQDKDSLDLAEVDFSKVLFETCLKEGEKYITGEEKLKRLKKIGHVQLDAGIFLALWQEKDQRTLKQLADRGITYLDFFGTVLRHPDGYRYVLCLYFDGGEWHWACRWLDGDWGVPRPSAVLASI